MTAPTPTAADRALATAFVDGPYRRTCCPVWFANHRDDAIRHIAMAEMQKRQRAEFINTALWVRDLASSKRRVW